MSALMNIVFANRGRCISCISAIKNLQTLTRSYEQLYLRFVYRLIIARALSCEPIDSNHTIRNKETKNAMRKRIKIETGSLARFADGAAVVQMGNTAALVTVVGSKETSTSNFLPLTVDYRQKAAAAGRIPTNHLRRERGPTEKEILTSRLIDRSIRPMFPKDFIKEVQVTCNLLSVDGENDPELASINAASAALYISNIPWDGPVGAVRIGVKKSFGQCILNPTRKQQEDCKWNCIVVVNKYGDIVMLEGNGKNLPLEKTQECIRYGIDFAKAISHMIVEDLTRVQKRKEKYSPPYVIPDLLATAVETFTKTDIMKILQDTTHDKTSRDTALKDLRFKTAIQLKDQFPEQEQLIHEAFTIVLKKLFRDQILNTKTRCDGRKLFFVRGITSRVDLYKPLHGSALFQRGQTQVLCTVAFDSLDSALKSDPVSIATGAIPEKNFMLHYEFPSYSTNEIKQGGTAGRRELGHGALAEKALRPVIPDDYPFCIRLTSEVMESNGSSSMASVCGGSLALMDAGVPISEPLAGIAMGLVTAREGDTITDYSIMTDILGMEDYLGDMDLKIAGSCNGVTALQLDLKIPGAPKEIIMEAMKQSQTGLRYVLYQMAKTLKEHRKEKKQNHPVIENLQVLPAERARFLGIGGYNLRKLRSDTGVTITPVDESTYQIFAPNQAAMDEAKVIIKSLVEEKKVPELEFNAIYQAKITEIRDIGVMIQFHPSMEPVLLHNSQLDDRPVSHPSSLGFEVGQLISVKYFGRDPATGRMRISRKVITAQSSRSLDLISER